MTDEFILDPRLVADTVPVGDLALCSVLLMDDARFPWLILVPRRAGASELTDLSAEDAHDLMDEIRIATGVMLALAQVGVNIAPLLAGAGVVGLAIGFGAQKLVQDIITGVFIQLENALNEGDVVAAGGVSGVVERLTIRSLSIRDGSGTLHLIPFSAVTTVANMMKDFGFHVADIAVSYRESIPEVKEALQEAFTRLQATEHGANIIGELDMQGITGFGESAIMMRVRIKTQAGKHWGAGRAYSEIVKLVFEERGIEMPYPHRTVSWGGDEAKAAAPAPARG